ncbi:hypothetical protein REPUB_Repub20aG0018300 [Reevesia pubescens]
MYSKVFRDAINGFKVKLNHTRQAFNRIMLSPDVQAQATMMTILSGAVTFKTLNEKEDLNEMSKQGFANMKAESAETLVEAQAKEEDLNERMKQGFANMKAELAEIMGKMKK